MLLLRSLLQIWAFKLVSFVLLTKSANAALQWFSLLLPIIDINPKMSRSKTETKRRKPNCTRSWIVCSFQRNNIKDICVHDNWIQRMTKAEGRTWIFTLAYLAQLCKVIFFRNCVHQWWLSIDENATFTKVIVRDVIKWSFYIPHVLNKRNTKGITHNSTFMPFQNWLKTIIKRKTSIQVTVLFQLKTKYSSQNAIKLTGNLSSTWVISKAVAKGLFQGSWKETS